METTSAAPAAASTTTPAPVADESDTTEAPPAPRKYESQRNRASRTTVEVTKEEPEKEESEASLSSDQVRSLLKKGAAEKKEGDKPAEGGEDEGAETEGAAEKTPKLFAEKVKVKIDGKEAEVSVGDLAKAYQKAQAADKRFQEAAITKKQAAQLVNLLQTNPLSVLKHPALGISQEKYREMLETELYENFVKLDAMDPKDREIHELKHKLKVEEDGKKKQAEEAREQEMQALASKHTEDYQKQIISAIDTNGLPKSPYVVALYAKYLKQALSKGHRLKAEQVSDLVKEDVTSMYRDMFGSADGDRLISLFGDDVAEKINKARIKQLKKTETTSATSETRERSEKPAMTWADWRQRNRPK
jgi:hypothetical protein